MREEFLGLIAPPFTPMRADGSVDLGRIEKHAEAFAADGVRGAFVCGTTGEGVSLTLSERQAVAERWREVASTAGKDFLVFVNVGCLAVGDSRTLAADAQKIGADAIAAAAPSYFRPACAEDLVGFCAEIAAAAPKLPFYYYHIPAMTNVYLPVADFLAAAGERMPTLTGVKFTYEDLMDFGRCVRLAGGRYKMLFGRDEILLSGLALGAGGAIGTTYNFAAPLYYRILRAWEAGDLAAARKDQALAAEMIVLMRKFGGVPAAKAMMKMARLDCGPVRPPLADLTDEQFAELRRRLEAIGFFERCTKA